MFMEFATGVEGSTAYLCYFNKKRLIKILHSWGINDFREFLKNYIWDDTDAMMCEFEERGWSYKKVACEFQSEKEIFEELNKMKNVYVVLDNDMENSVVTVDTYATYEKAEQGVKDILADVADLYDQVEEYDNGWLLIDCDSTNRVIEIEASEVK